MTTNDEYTSLKAHTERSNKAFAKLTPAKKRVEVAKDVIKALKLKQLRPAHCTYLQIGRWDASMSNDTSRQAARLISENPDTSFQELLPELPTCTVCAKGAIFVCAVARQNQVTAYEANSSRIFDDDTALSEVLQGLFSQEQLDLIETEFESSTICGNSVPVMHLACRFGTAENRMLEVMRNIVSNRGRFRPEKFKCDPVTGMCGPTCRQ